VNGDIVSGVTHGQQWHHFWAVMTDSLEEKIKQRPTDATTADAADDKNEQSMTDYCEPGRLFWIDYGHWVLGNQCVSGCRRMHAVDRSRQRELIKDVWWSGWVWAGECFFWYRRTRVVCHWVKQQVPDQEIRITNTNITHINTSFSPAWHCSSMVLAMALCLSVCLSVTSWCSIEMAERIWLVFGMVASFNLSYARGALNAAQTPYLD